MQLYTYHFVAHFFFAVNFKSLIIFFYKVEYFYEFITVVPVSFYFLLWLQYCIYNYRLLFYVYMSTPDHTFCWLFCNIYKVQNYESVVWNTTLYYVSRKTILSYSLRIEPYYRNIQIKWYFMKIYGTRVFSKIRLAIIQTSTFFFIIE